MERVLVSSEIEGIIDKENILGTDSKVREKNIHVSQGDKEFLGSLERIRFTEDKIFISISVKNIEFKSVLAFLNRKEKIIVLGESIEIKALQDQLSSFSIHKKKDMYIWKIIIDNSE